MTDAKSKAINDATASIIGTVYQLCVALDKCYEMKSGQKLYIETFGDITVIGTESKQYEIKHYAAALTDSSENFWKTLYNWMQDGFPADQYSSLILVTTQEIGPKSSLGKWNNATAQERIEILDEIFKKSLNRDAKRALVKADDDEHGSPVVLKYQQYSLDSSRRSKLTQVAGKYIISASSPDLNGLYTELRELHCRHILKGKGSDYINALLGFLLDPVRIHTGWSVDCDEFNAKIVELTNRYRTETRKFPTDFLRQSASDVKAVESEQRLFIKKIEEIKHFEEVEYAIREYLYAKKTISEDLRKYGLYSDDIDQFETKVRRDFTVRYRRAVEELKAELDALSQSRVFYDTVIAENAPTLAELGQAETGFRNGVLHMHMDDAAKSLKWRLK